MTTTADKKVRLDSFVNAMTGLGGLRDKLTATTFQRSGPIDDATLEGLFHEDDMAARICEAPIEHMFREGIELHVDGKADVVSKMMDWSEELCLVDAVRDASVFERLFGGAAVLIGADDGQSVDKPLRTDRLRSIGYLQTLDKRDLEAKDWDSDPQSKHFGTPETYTLRRQSAGGKVSVPLVVHRSRLVVFGGGRATLRSRIEHRGWGCSVLRRCYEPLKQFQANYQAAAHLMQESSIGVFAVDGFIDILASNNRELLNTRMDVLDTFKSSIRSVVIDAQQESFTRTEANLSGIPPMLEQSSVRLAAAAKMPVTVIMGRSPAGMSATGESDIRNWYDELSAEQSKKAQLIEQLFRLMFLSKEGPTRGIEPDTWRIDFPPLWQMSPKEEAELRKMHAETDALWISNEVVLPEEVAISRFRPEGYSNDLEIDLSVREQALEAELEKLLDPPAPPPVPPVIVPPPGTPAGPVPPTDEQQKQLALAGT